MNNSRFRTRTIANLIYSTIITLLVELFLVSNLTRVADHLAGSPSYIHETIVVLLFVLFGIVLFVLSFWLMERHTINYLAKITEGVRNITSGDLNSRIEVEGDNEFTELAVELNAMAEDIQVLMDKERESERTKNELITNIAHDLRTPLTSIIGYLDLLAHRQDIPEVKKNEYANIAYTKAKKLETLIEDLFGYTKLNYGRIAMNVERIDVVKLLGQMMDEFYPTFENNHLEYELTSNVPGAVINADGKLLARLFDNLINNAVKYGAEGKRIDVHINADPKNVTVAVVNYGRIIPENELPLIFDRFYRVEQSRSSSTGGTGLGLAIAKNIVEMHHGRIEVKSDLQGTRFLVTLPTDLDIGRENFERTE